MNAKEKQFITDAVKFFEKPGIFIRGANILASPIEKIHKRLPKTVQSKLNEVIKVSLEKALVVSVKTVKKEKTNQLLEEAVAPSLKSSRRHQFASIVTGGIGGALGGPGLLVELPITTVLMLRSIAAIAQEFGEDLTTPEAMLECLTVFSFGGPSAGDDLTDTAYYGTRMSLSFAVKEATVYLASIQTAELLSHIESGAAPALVKLIAKIASNFEIRVTRKLLMQLAPILGIAGGAAVNAAFMQFFNQAARYHFGLRNLERLHGEKAVQGSYTLLASGVKKT